MDRRTVTVVVWVAALGVVFSACGSSSPTAPSTSSITVTGTVPAVGQTSQLAAKATLSNGTSQDVTTQATWSSSNTAIATVTSGGLLRVLALGGATITATYQNVSGTLSVSLQVSLVAVTGPALITNGTAAKQYTATATFSNGNTQDVTSQAQWQSSNSAVLQLDCCGGSSVARAFAVGVADITANYSGVVGRISVTVAAPPCQFIVTDSSGRPVGGDLRIPSGARSGATIKVQMTAGGSECNWNAGVGATTPGAGFHLDPGSVTLTAVSQSGSNTAGPSPSSYPSVNGSGNGTITIIFDANPNSGVRAGEIAISIISCSSCNREVGMVNGQTNWFDFLLQAGR